MPALRKPLWIVFGALTFFAAAISMFDMMPINGNKTALTMKSEKCGYATGSLQNVEHLQHMSGVVR